MSEIRDNPIPIKSRQFSSRLRKLLFIGLAAIGLLIIWWRVSRIANLKGPQYPNAQSIALLSVGSWDLTAVRAQTDGQS